MNHKNSFFHTPYSELPTPNSKNAGFTLLELMIVISIIAILAATLIPNIVGFDTDARLASTKTNLNTLRTRLSLFRAKEGRYPKEFEELTTVTYNDAGIEKPYLEQIPVEFISSAAGSNQVDNLSSADALPDDGGWVYLTDKAKIIVDWDKELEHKWDKAEGQTPSKW